MTITRNDSDDIYGPNGLISSTPVVRDITIDTNRRTITQQAQTALATNAAALALPDPTPGNTTYLGIGSPSNAQVVAQVRALTQQNNALAAQVTALTRQNNALIRLALSQFDATT